MDMMTIPMTVPRAMAPYLDDREQDHSFADEANAIRTSAFIRVVSVQDRNAVDVLQKVSGLDLGESEAIIYAYADESKADILLIEEEAGRRVA